MKRVKAGKNKHIPLTAPIPGSSLFSGTEIAKE